MKTHADASAHGGKIGKSLPPSNRQKPTAIRNSASLAVLSDYRSGMGDKTTKDRHGQRPLSRVDGIPYLQKLELARVINELAQAWGVDLALVIAVRDGKCEPRTTRRRLQAVPV